MAPPPRSRNGGETWGTRRMAAEARWEKQRKRLERLVGEITKGTKDLEKKSRKKK